MHQIHISFATLVRTSLVLLGLLCLLAYVLWQARFLLAGPQVVITEAPERVTAERIVTIAGQANNITSITLNGRQIFTDPTGYFREALVLENGYTIATIAATDRYGRTKKLERPFIYIPASRI
ncbi:MAG: Glucodextranase, domain [Candidatus Parcubacteria bacterium]